MAFLKNLSRFLGGSSAAEPAIHLAAFGKHPGWNDHIDDLGLDTDALVNAKRLLYIQGISQNIDNGAWDKLDAQEPDAPVSAITRLDQFRHDFLWHMPMPAGPALLAGRLWSSSDGKGRDKYPMVLCAQVSDLPDRFATRIVLPFLTQVHEQCAAATTAETIRQTISTRRDALRALIKDTLAIDPLTARQLVAIARHPDMCVSDPGSASHGGGGGGFHRIVYTFVKAMAVYRSAAGNGGRSASLRSEQMRVPACAMGTADALLFWLRFAQTLLDPGTSLLLMAPDQARAPWVDLIAGEPSPTNLFCIKAGPRNFPFTSDIPYTLDPSLVRAIDGYVAQCAELPDSAVLPVWPDF